MGRSDTISAMPQTVPRVRPRMPMEDLVDRRKHPPRRQIPTRAEKGEGLPVHAMAALVALAVFWVALPAAGVLGPLLGLWAGLGCLGLAASSLVVAWFLGSE